MNGNVHLPVEAAEGRKDHNNGWNGTNGIKHKETKCLMYLIPFRSSHYYEPVLPN